MPGETQLLAERAGALTFDVIPPDVIQRIKDCMADTVAAIIYGQRLPWSQIVLDYAAANGSEGKSRVLGVAGSGFRPPMAAFANGALSHAFELDNVTQPGSGVHVGACALPAALAIAQDRGASGRTLLTAMVAAAEVAVRIGWATKHSNEKRGFHAPGTTGPFGAAIAAGLMLGLGTEQLHNALGIAGSTSSGLMEFARSGTGAMVKRLHIGRAAESGVLAASLAQRGFTGPLSVIEGKAGFLQVFCTDSDPSYLTRGWGEDWATMAICIKRYPCHITSQQAVQAMQELRQEFGFTGADVNAITVTGAERMARANNITEPTDVMMAQYSAPFCVSLAVYGNPGDPAQFNEATVANPEIRSLCRRVTVQATKGYEHHSDAPTTVSVTLSDGRKLERTVTAYKGSPSNPFGRDDMRTKFLTLTHGFAGAEEFFERIQNIENETDFDWLR